jgi:TfoX/Sxy family transcriptional regulator of competence genes
MAYDEGIAQILRDDLVAEAVVERKMFGGLAFLIAGHMVAGVHKGGAMFRIAAPDRAAALALPGAFQLMMGDRPMAGMLGLSPEDAVDDVRRGALLALALRAVQALPPKVAKTKKG